MPEEIVHAPAIGIIGGMGFFGFDGLDDFEEHRIETPYGDPSCTLIGGALSGRKVWFLARHGAGYSVAAHEINHRANVWALRSLGIRWVLGVSTVGSLRDTLPPRSLILTNQFFSRMSENRSMTFFGEGIIAHPEFADPTCPELDNLVRKAAELAEVPLVPEGVQVGIDGPVFSTRAEAQFYKRQGYDVVGLTPLPEARLCREAGIAYSCLGAVNAFESYRKDGGKVDVHEIGRSLNATGRQVVDVLHELVPLVPEVPEWPTHQSLAGRIFTQRHLWPEEAIERLRPLLEPYLGAP